jgi:protein-tyrosine-phosphatase
MAAGLLMLAWAGQSRAAACAPLHVLFVCPVGTVKSAIAREALRRRVALLRLPVAVESRGLSPANHLTPALIERLRAEDVTRADIVIAFDEAAGSPLLAKAQAWRTPSWLASYDAAKADLAARLDGLLAELTRTCPPQAG